MPHTTTKSVKQVLRDLGVDSDIRNKHGRMAAMTAGAKGKLESVKLLQEMTADLNVGEEDGYTLIHYAASNDYTAMLKVMSGQ